VKKKNRLITLIIILVSVLIFPIPVVYRDGGTRTYTAFLYRIIIWNQLDIESETGYRTGMEFYFFPNNFKSLNDY